MGPNFPCQDKFNHQEQEEDTHQEGGEILAAGGSEIAGFRLGALGHGAHVAFRGFHGGHRFRDFFGGFRQEKVQEILNEDGKIILEGEVGILQAEAEGRLAVGISQEHVAGFAPR